MDQGGNTSFKATVCNFKKICGGENSLNSSLRPDRNPEIKCLWFHPLPLQILQNAALIM